jgi:hypothetical protein
MNENVKTDPDAASHLIRIIIVATAGLAAGYITKKLVVGRSANVFRKLTAAVLQIGVTSVIAQHPAAVRTFGRFIIHLFPQKKKEVQASHAK